LSILTLSDIKKSLYYPWLIVEAISSLKERFSQYRPAKRASSLYYHNLSNKDPDSQFSSQANGTAEKEVDKASCRGSGGVPQL